MLREGLNAFVLLYSNCAFGLFGKRELPHHALQRSEHKSAKPKHMRDAVEPDTEVLRVSAR